MTESTSRAPYIVVVGVDFEKTGDDALADALRLVREHPNDELHAVHVVKLGGDHHSASELAKIERQMADAAENLEVRVHNICEAIFPDEIWEQSVHYHVRVGDPADQLHQVAVDYDGDLLIVGTHARTGLKKLLLGSVAQRLVETASLPVLIAREKHFEGLRTSDKADAPRPGEDLEGGFHRAEHVSFGSRGGHISGLL